MAEQVISDAASLGRVIRDRRKALGLRQPDLALAANVGVRFIVDVENGKESCQLGLALRLLQALGVRLTANSEPVPATEPEDEFGIEDGSVP